MINPVLIAGQWRPACCSETFRAENPNNGEPLPDEYPISNWEDCDVAMKAAATAFHELQSTSPDKIAIFLDAYASAIERHTDALVSMAHAETGLAASPRLKDVELPRTVNQLRQAASVAREGSWAMPTIDTKLNIRSCFAAIGPVWVFGPNNFPFAFNSIAGGDFASAIAAGNPVIAKANTSHPGTTRLFAELAQETVERTGMPQATVQLLYRIHHTDGVRAVADARIGATAYTGSRSAGLTLKAAADAVGKPIYAELSSINPVIILPGALSERSSKITDEFTSSCLMGAGQFCTNPGLVLLLAGKETEEFIANAAKAFASTPSGTLLSRRVAETLSQSVQILKTAGATIVAGGTLENGRRQSYANTLLRVSATTFLKSAEAFQTEAFGNASLVVVADDPGQLIAAVQSLEGNLTGCIYSSTTGQDDQLYEQIVPHLRHRVGRLLNDKMPTGVAVSSAMNHGGPFPATGHPGFSAVGFPGSIRRFAALECYDNVRPDRLPLVLQDKNPTKNTWRLIDEAWSKDDVTA
jgi:2,5-dioxopentanoate dehydrogenase